MSLSHFFKIISRADGLCEYCNKKGEVIHHKNKNHGDNRLENLQFLCQKCHMSLHNTGEGNGRWLGDKALPHAKYMRKWRKKQRVKGVN